DAERPPLVKLPAPEPTDLKEALILEDLGGLFADMRSREAHPPQPGYLPAMTEYWVNYVKKKNLPLGQYQGRVVVGVEQCPNEQWARYRQKYPEPFRPLLDERSKIPRVV